MLLAFDAAVLVLVGSDELAVADVDFRMGVLPYDVAGPQVGRVGPVMPFEARLFQGCAFLAGGEGGGSHVEAGMFQRIVDQAGAVVVRVAVAVRLAVAMGVVGGYLQRPAHP